MRGATSWLDWYVFLPEVKAGNPDVSSQLQRAFSGGCLAARTLLDEGKDLPLELSQIPAIESRKQQRGSGDRTDCDLTIRLGP
jgi:hypothetical protein